LFSILNSSASTVFVDSLALHDLMMAPDVENRRSTVVYDAGMLKYLQLPVSDGQIQVLLKMDKGFSTSNESMVIVALWSLAITLYYGKNCDLEWFQIKSHNFESNPNQITCFPNQIIILQIKSLCAIQSWFKSNHDLDLPITAHQHRMKLVDSRECVCGHGIEDEDHFFFSLPSIQWKQKTVNAGDSRYLVKHFWQRSSAAVRCTAAGTFLFFHV